MPLLIVRQLQLNEVFQDMARVALEHRPHSKAGKIIVISAGGKTARAIARAARGNDRNSIYLDDATRDRLGVSSGEQLEFIIRRGRIWDEFVWAWQATNAVTRVAARLGVISVGLGAGGLALGLLSILLTVCGT